MPDWAHAHAELRRPGVTLALLWQENRLAHPQDFLPLVPEEHINLPGLDYYH